MSDVFSRPLKEIQPSQLYISQAKLDLLLRELAEEGLNSVEPISVKLLDGEIISTDGHTRGVALFLNGQTETQCVWEDLEWDWDAYRICVRWCKESGITSMADLANRVISHNDYEVLWLERCRVMQEDLGSRRDENSKNTSS